MNSLALIALLAAPAFADSRHHHHDEGDKTSMGYRQFDRLRSLLGEWEGKGPEGKPLRLWYKLISGGSVLVETEKIGDEPEMITVYHLDDDALMLTHYCSANNQPRMHVEPSEDPIDEIRFKLDSVTNLKRSGGAFMNGLTVTLKGDRLRQRWTWLEGEKEKVFEFELTRRKGAASAPAQVPARANAQPS